MKNTDQRILGPIVLGLMMLTSMALASPLAAANGCSDQNLDITEDEEGQGWIRVSQPTTTQVRASELLYLFLFGAQGIDTGVGGPNVAGWTNGVDAYVHDMGCDVSGDLSYRIGEVSGDEYGNDIVQGGANELIDVQGADNDWGVAFFDGDRPFTHLATHRIDGDNWEDPANRKQVPDGARYAVVFLLHDQVDSSEPLDGAENLVPSGYQTLDQVWGPYTIKFKFDVILSSG